MTTPTFSQFLFEKIKPYVELETWHEFDIFIHEFRILFPNLSFKIDRSHIQAWVDIQPRFETNDSDMKREFKSGKVVTLEYHPETGFGLYLDNFSPNNPDEIHSTQLSLFKRLWEIFPDYKSQSPSEFLYPLSNLEQEGLYGSAIYYIHNFKSMSEQYKKSHATPKQSAYYTSLDKLFHCHDSEILKELLQQFELSVSFRLGLISTSSGLSLNQMKKLESILHTDNIYIGANSYQDNYGCYTFPHLSLTFKIGEDNQTALLQEYKIFLYHQDDKNQTTEK